MHAGDGRIAGFQLAVDVHVFVDLARDQHRQRSLRHLRNGAGGVDVLRRGGGRHVTIVGKVKPAAGKTRVERVEELPGAGGVVVMGRRKSGRQNRVLHLGAIHVAILVPVGHAVVKADLEHQFVAGIEVGEVDRQELAAVVHVDLGRVARRDRLDRGRNVAGNGAAGSRRKNRAPRDAVDLQLGVDGQFRELRAGSAAVKGERKNIAGRVAPPPLSK